MIRRPAVAGQFYPSDPQKIRSLINSFKLAKPTQKEDVIACILPHAGYIYSGKVAAVVLSQIKVAETCVIIGPNHTGYGVPASIMREGQWLTPVGSIKIDTELADKIIKNSKYLEADELAHNYEHSIEVQLPLIQEISNPDFTFVPIILASGNDLVYKDIANALAQAIQGEERRATIIASSDMTHFESQKSANRKDEEAIKAILELDEKKLLEKVEQLGISMCGYVPVFVSILAAKKLGAKKARLIAYQTSGDITGDYSSVVGYAGLVIQ